ncbi:MAG: TIGR03435 family protein [Bryobacterales bacterium]|nr:TIGR03435 family protein [Bryobacterales bacterium]MBV9401902.1 TIGR03435 family protein [Bryobacterales bacterium]
MSTAFIVNHLWQSSWFVFLAALLAFALRRHSPKIRYWVWLSASLKFLIPFALLVSFGNQVPLPTAHSAAAADPIFPATLAQIAEPFSPAPRPAVQAHNPMHWMPIAISIVWALGVLAITLARCRGWLKVRAALRAGTPVELLIPVRAVITPGAEEPGVVGFLSPVLVLPAQLLEHLNPRQLGAILTHELCHARRRDNLFAAVHMAVEAIFWFHPLVWWVGSRLLEERELACDEEVLRTGCEPSEYVEGILKVCRFYTESPLPCVSGVTGADVKRRLRSILAGTIAAELSGARKAALALAGLAALATPILIGVMTAPVIRAQSPPADTPRFEVASIKPCKEANNGPSPKSSPGRLVEDCHGLLNLIGNAYTTYADGRLNRNSERAPITGGPSWLRSAAYEIKATAEGNPSVPMMLGPMLQRLLEDRFHLKIHRETRDGPVYFLTVARGGPKLHPFGEGSCTPWAVPPPPREPGTRYCANIISLISSSVEALGATLDEFSKTLGTVVGRPVIDKTGITGRFDIRIKFAREGTTLAADYVRLIGPPPASDPRPASDPTDPPSIFVALQEELGLRLEAGRGPVETLVIDHIEKPSEN